MEVCKHEYENANCTNCANGLPTSAYECAKTKGTLKEYCHKRAEELHRQKYNEGYEQGYEQGREDAYKTFAEVIALDIADCSRCPIDCDVATYGDCEKALIAYVEDSMK